MPLTFIQHEKISLKGNPDFNEKWLHDRICEDPSILELGDVRLLDRERASSGPGRLDLLLYDEENNRRYEVEVMLGATDPSHIIRTIEYWDLEKRKYPAYDHVAVLIAESITTRFLNVIGLFKGSIPLIAIQIDALRVGQHIVLSFVHVLDQTDLREDDTEGDSGGGEVDRAYWNQKAGPMLMEICDDVLGTIKQTTKDPWELNYLRGYIGLKSNGVVRNFVSLGPKRTKKIVHIRFLSANTAQWKDRFEQAGVPVQSGRQGRRFWVTVTPEEFAEHRELIRQAVEETVRESA